MDEAHPTNITEHGMTVRWQFTGDRLHVTVSAPTQGWLAVGFNTEHGLSGTDLIMGAVLPEGQIRVEEHAVIRAGLHQVRATLGLTERLSDIEGWQSPSETSIAFAVPTHAAEAYSYNLVPGQPIVMLLAYSHHTNFNHHSAMRTHVEVTL